MTFPPELRSAPFHVSLAESCGLSRGQLRSSSWVRLFRNIYVAADVTMTDELRLKAARLALPPGTAAIDLTAAWLLGVWQPAPGAPVPMQFGVPRGRVAARNEQARTRRMTLDEGDLDTFDGVLVTTPERTCFGLMAASSPVEAVVWADSFLHAGVVTRDGLRRYADERPRRPHVRKVRFAVGLARHEAASPMESRLRMVIVMAGLPEPPLLNAPVHDSNGREIGRPDLLYLEPLFGIEYDGSYHQDRNVRIIDNRRENRLLLGNVPLLRYCADDVFRTPHRIVLEVGEMLRRAR